MSHVLLAFLLSLIFSSQVLARPVNREEYISAENDLTAVGSYRRETREPLPPSFAIEAEDILSAGSEPKKNTKNASGKSDEGGYYKTYGSDADGEKGYLKATYSKGDQGYKSLDTFHKRDGDKYEFEQHTAYGKARANEEKSHKGSAGSSSNVDHDAAGTRVHEQQADNQGQGDESEAQYTEPAEGQYYDDDDGHYDAHYEAKPEFSSYTDDRGHGDNYSGSAGDEGSYQTHSSYSSDGDEGANYEASHY